MARYIVTVKLPPNPRHDPRNKVTGVCPVSTTGSTCTDVTGAHHSVLIDGEEGLAAFRAATAHITRIEEV